MAETLRELVVALSLDSSNFSRNMRTINAQIKEAESTFRLAGAGVQNFEKTVAGTEAKLSMLGNKLTQQNRAVEQYSRALVAANDKLKENYNRHQDYSQRLEQAKARQEALRFEVETATFAYQQYRDSLGETDSATIAAKQNMERYQEEYEETTAEVTKLDGQVKALQKTMQNSADTVSKAQTDLNNAKAGVRETEAEIHRLTEQLYRMQSAWTQAGEALTAIGKKCETISKAMSKAGKSMTRYITTPIVGLGTAAIKASVDYEYAFADVRKTVDATEEEYQELSNSVKQMSTEVAASAEDIAEVMSIAGQLGIENEHLAEFSRTMIDLGNSTNMVSADAASQAARFANIMGMSQEQFQNLGSTLVDLGNNYATTESEIMEIGKVSERANAVEINPDWDIYHGSEKISGTVPITRGGTGGTTAAAARSNLGVVNKAGDTMTGNLNIQGTLYPSMLLLPTNNGTTNRTVFEGSYVGASSFAAWEDATGNNRRMLEVRTKAYAASLDNAVMVRVCDGGTWGNYRVFHAGMPTGVPIANGGTGATTAATARSNLGANNAGNLTTGTLPAARLPFKIQYGQTTVTGVAWTTVTLSGFTSTPTIVVSYAGNPSSSGIAVLKTGSESASSFQVCMAGSSGSGSRKVNWIAIGT